MALDASFVLEIEGCDKQLSVGAMAGTERAAGLFDLTVTAYAPDGEGRRARLDAEELLGQPAKLTLVDENAPRTLHGIIDRVEQTMTGYRFALVPRAASLGDSVNHRGFLDLDAVAIVEGVLTELGLDVEIRVADTPAKRPQCVQAFESDLAFCARLMAEEGILWHLDHEGGEDVVVLSDHSEAYAPISGADELRVSEGQSAGMGGGETAYELVLEQRAVPDKITLRDYDLERPTVDLTVSEGSGATEIYEYPGGYVDPAVGATLARRRLEEARATRTVLAGKTTCRRLAPGLTFSLADAPRDDMAGRWLVLELSHEGHDHGGSAGRTDDPDDVDANSDGDARGAVKRRYEARFTAVPVDVPYRAGRPEGEARGPTFGGVQTVTVTGPSGSEIHPDKHGRIKALLRWDRLRSADDTSSHWIRPIQPPTSGGFFLPRMGWESLVAFSGKAGDTPYQIGRLYNAQSTPPSRQPDHKICSTFGTATTPGGGSANILHMDDTAGNEALAITASKDFNERTENDKGTAVKVDETHIIGGNRTHIVGIVQSISVDGAQTYSVGGTRDVTVHKNKSISAASESVSVGGLRLFEVGGDYETKAATLSRAVGAAKAVVAIQEVNRHVTGVSTVAVGGAWSETGGLSSATSVLGASVLQAGPTSFKAPTYSLKASVLKETYSSCSVTAGGERVEAFGAAAKYNVGGSLKLKGSSVLFKGGSKITLKASGVTIVITSSAIKVKGKFDATDASIVTGDEAND